MRRKWRPTAMLTLASPDNPRGSPHTVRHPNPPATRMQIPSAIMERRPAPGIIRLPEPSRIGPYPMARITIRTPCVIDYNHPRLPAPAHAFEFDPCAVGRKIIIEVSRFRRRAADV